MNLSVKTIIFAAVACSSFAGISSAMADVGNPTLPAGKQVSAITMHMTGTITNSTCNIRPYTTAGADATTLNMGVLTKGKTSETVSFFLKPVDGCITGITTGSKSADITWESNGLTDHGISNMYGTAKNVHLELSPASGEGAAEINGDASAVADKGVVKTGSQTVVYNKIATGGDPAAALPFKYNVQLVSDNGNDMEAGTFDTDVSYTVAYK